MKTISAFVAALTLLAAPAIANAQYHFQILDTTFQGDCGSINPEINTLGGDPTIDLVFPTFGVEASRNNSPARKLCNVRVRVKADRGYRLSLQGVFYEGKVQIDPAGGSANVSARTFFQGLPSLRGFRDFSAGAAEDFTVRVRQGTPNTSCGAETYLNMLADVTARVQPGNGSFSEIAIQRAVGTPQAVVHCVIRPTRCP